MRQRKIGLLEQSENGPLTIRPRMTISQDALTMYIFQPIFSRPIGMMKTKTSLGACQLVASLAVLAP